MINFHRYTLENGLKVILHQDESTPIAAVNVLYNVGSRDENPKRTGFAHLFEHLMFAGSKHIPDFDSPIQRAGGENNAFTNYDITNFYETAPTQNLETLLWLESDRMLALNINKKSLEVQRKVVVEEFKETTLNEPYGDIWHHLGALAYKKHPYKWPPIGLKPKHVQDATLQDVKEFYQNHYRPNNAILSIAGNIDLDTTKDLVEKWFGNIPKGNIPHRALPQETPQKKLQRKTVEANVPIDALYMVFHSPARMEQDYYVVDLLTDILGGGASARLYRRLLKENRIFSEIDTYQTGNIDPSLVVIEGKPAEGISLEQAEEAIWKELDLIISEEVSERELQKLKNKLESQQAFSDAGALNKAMNLSFYELLGDANLINSEIDAYNKINAQDLIRVAKHIFRKENASILYYKKKSETTAAK
jgi:zinc protease